MADGNMKLQIRKTRIWWWRCVGFSNGAKNARGSRCLHRGTEKKPPWIEPIGWRKREALHGMISKAGEVSPADDLRHILRVK